MLNDTEAAYAAGILDGEGSIALTRNRVGRWPSPQVSVASIDRELLKWLRDRFGGSIVRKKPRRRSHSQSFEWKLTDRRALDFLEQVRPYLVIERKTQRADLLLDEYLSCTPRNGRHTPSIARRKKELIKQFASLP